MSHPGWDSAAENYDVEGGVNDPAEAAKNGPTKCNTKCRWVGIIWSACLGIIFVISYAVQFNDTDSVAAWSVFYLLQAAVALLSVVAHWWVGAWLRKGLPRKAVLVLIAVVSLYSIVLLGISSKKYSDADWENAVKTTAAAGNYDEVSDYGDTGAVDGEDEGFYEDYDYADETDEGNGDRFLADGGDNPNANSQEEVSYEIAGAMLGLVSALYHAIYFAGICCFTVPE
eukprot:scaffold4850_cov50-Attheya_sp.AAC.5